MKSQTVRTVVLMRVYGPDQCGARATAMQGSPEPSVQGLDGSEGSAFSSPLYLLLLGLLFLLLLLLLLLLWLSLFLLLLCV
jgi:hypothetical protein